MKQRVGIVLATVLLTACPGGWRTVMVSTYSLAQPRPGEVLFHEGYLSEYAIPAVKIDDVLYAQMRSDNRDDLRIESSLDARYSIEAWFSANQNDVRIDASSFLLNHSDKNSSLRPTVLVTHERAVVTTYGREPYTVCDFQYPYDGTQKVTGLIPVPRLGDSAWPPENYDDSVLCMRLVFDASVSEVPPQQQFQLSFQYYIGEQSKDVTLYFYPLKYTVFRH